MSRFSIAMIIAMTIYIPPSKLKPLCTYMSASQKCLDRWSLPKSTIEVATTSGAGFCIVLKYKHA